MQLTLLPIKYSVASAASYLNTYVNIYFFSTPPRQTKYECTLKCITQILAHNKKASKWLCLHNFSNCLCYFMRLLLRQRWQFAVLHNTLHNKEMHTIAYLYVCNYAFMLNNVCTTVCLHPSQRAVHLSICIRANEITISRHLSPTMRAQLSASTKVIHCSSNTCNTYVCVCVRVGVLQATQLHYTCSPPSRHSSVYAHFS